MNNKFYVSKFRGGFSFAEIIISLGLFLVMLTVVLPMLLQAARNMNYAENSYKNQLLAQEMMHTLCNTLRNGNEPCSAALTFANSHNIELYGVWIFGKSENSFSSAGAPWVSVSIEKEMPYINDKTSVVVVIIWGENGNIAGRATGIVNYSESRHEST